MYYAGGHWACYKVLTSGWNLVCNILSLIQENVFGSIRQSCFQTETFVFPGIHHYLKIVVAVISCHDGFHEPAVS